MQLFTGSVVFAADPEPKDWGNGPRFSIKVLLDQPAPAGAKTDDRGRVAVYVNPTDAETPYLRSLKRDDRVQLSWDEGNSKKKSLDLIIPAGFSGGSPPPQQPAISQYAAPATTQATNPNQLTPLTPPPSPVWYPPSDADKDAKVAIATETIRLQLELMTVTQVEAAKAGFELSIDVVQDIAVTGLIAADKQFRPGMTVYKPAELDEVERAFLAGLDTSTPDALLASVLDGIGAAVKETRNDVAALLKSFGLSRDAITGSQDSQLFLLNVARTYTDTKLVDGEAAARRKVEAQFGLKDASIF